MGMEPILWRSFGRAGKKNPPLPDLLARARRHPPEHAQHDNGRRQQDDDADGNGGLEPERKGIAGGFQKGGPLTGAISGRVDSSVAGSSGMRARFRVADDFAFDDAPVRRPGTRMLTEALPQLSRSPPEISATGQSGQGDDGQHHNRKHERAHQNQCSRDGGGDFAQQALGLHLVLAAFAAKPEPDFVCMHWIEIEWVFQRSGVIDYSFDAGSPIVSRTEACYTGLYMGDGAKNSKVDLQDATGEGPPFTRSAPT